MYVHTNYTKAFEKNTKRFCQNKKMERFETELTKP